MQKTMHEGHLKELIEFLKKNPDFTKNVSSNPDFFEKVLSNSNFVEKAIRHPDATQLLVNYPRLAGVLLRHNELEGVYIPYILHQPVILKNATPVEYDYHKTKAAVRFEVESGDKVYRIDVWMYKSKWKKVRTALEKFGVDEKATDWQIANYVLPLQYDDRGTKVTVTKTEDGYKLTIDNLEIFLTSETAGNLLYLLKKAGI